MNKLAWAEALSTKLEPGEVIVYYTSDGVEQKKLVKTLVAFEDKVGFFMEPGETAIIPVTPTKAQHHLVCNVPENTLRGLVVLTPQYIDGEVTNVTVKNHSRTRVIVFDGADIAHIIPLTKARGAAR